MFLPIRFQSLEFEHRSVLIGGQREWVPVGMPQIPRLIETCSFFLFADTDKGRKGPLASGFFVGMRTGGDGLPDIHHTYAITNAHAAPDGASVIRCTLANGSTKFLELAPHEWEFIAGGDDIAVVDVTDKFVPGEYHSAVGTNMMMTDQFMEDAHVGIGEDGFMIGLFADEPGQHSNHYVGRFGNLASFPTKIEQPNGHKRPSFIFDIRSRTGFSGSPVFVYRTIGSDVTDAIGVPEYVPQPKIRVMKYLKLLGIHCGQYKELIEFKVVPKNPQREGVELSDGDKLLVPSSMTIVAPAWEIEKLINLKKFREQRNDREIRIMSSEEYQRKPIPEATISAVQPKSPKALAGTEPVRPDPPDSDKGRFTALLNAAATKKSPDG